MAKGDTAWAECRLRNILKEEPGNLIVLLVQGDIALWRGNLQEACSIFSRMVKTAPGRPELRYKLGLSLEGLGKWTEAAQEYQRIVKQEPDYWPAWLGLSRCYLLSGDPEASRQALERATSTSDRITDEEDETP
jgi:predicted Zn-dependent protease